ncbi:CoA-binding protein [Polaribacter tangerinus]|uniref:CoA-binding protein n=1 Tax=Polaribacter tangerinus TaxID=1920034 RepID=UPI000B4B61A7|nr:CoA-binding protein [Polaribacter tangerinus]
MSKKTLVIGASLKEERYSNKAIVKLVENNIEVVAVGLRSGVVAGVNIDTEKLDFKNIHTVTLYLSANRQDEFYNYIISLQPERVIFNPGTENEEFYKLLEAKNIKVEVACTLVLLATKQY